ncbi:MAG: hypothetical protein Q8P83_00870 [bacterium]|nr:hypothetical protein [bacterium]
MNKFYIAFGIITAIVISAVAYGLSVVDSPSQKRQEKFDETRVSNFRNISYQVENYYTSNKRLPSKLEDLTGIKYQDPETGDSYDYLTQSDVKYKLCTIFGTDSINEDQDNFLGYTNSEHSKGYDCIAYEIPEHLKKNTNSLDFLQPPSQPLSEFTSPDVEFSSPNPNE